MGSGFISRSDDVPDPVCAASASVVLPTAPPRGYAALGRVGIALRHRRIEVGLSALAQPQNTMNGQLYNEGSASRTNVPALKLALVSFLTGAYFKISKALKLSPSSKVALRARSSRECRVKSPRS